MSKNNLRRWRSAAVVAALLPWIAACSSMAGGMNAHNFSPSAASPMPETPIQVTPITSHLVKSEKEFRDRQASNDISKLVAKPKPYAIESGDILSIVVWDHPELAGAVMNMRPSGVEGVDAATATSPPAGFVVDHEGMVQFPYAGALKVAGLTQEEARTLLTTKLARYINKPNVTLRVQSYRSKRIYIDGQVKSPGVQAINDIPMTLVEALNRAGGVLPTADQNQMIISRNGTSYPINFLQLVQKGVDPSTILLSNGDVVRVLSREESKVFVSGEVIAPRALTMHNGRLTLNEALGEAGGVNPITGDGQQIYVVRKTPQAPVVYQLDARSPGALALAEGFELNSKDVVYVAATPLANWQRTISLILPGAVTSAASMVVPAPR